MRKLIFLFLLSCLVCYVGCSAPSDVTTAGNRTAQCYIPEGCIALAFQLNTAYALGMSPSDPLVPTDVSLGELGATSEQVIQIMADGSLINAMIPEDVEVPEWDEWLLTTTMDAEVPDWEGWLANYYIPPPRYFTYWDEYGIEQTELQDVEVPEWDEWLFRFSFMQMQRSPDWMDWAVYGPAQIVDVEVPEWDEWLLNLTIDQMVASYEAWLELAPLTVF
jgi:hypothetical protein